MRRWSGGRVRSWMGLALLLATVSMLVGCGVTLPWAQQSRNVRIGYIGGSSTAVVTPLLEAFRDGMRQHGYVEGQTFTLTSALAEGQPDRLPGLAAELVASRPDLILVSGDQAIKAVQAATQTIPIVMVSCDAVAAGIIRSLAQPGGNTTGTTCISATVGAKRLQLLQDAVPRVKRIAIIWNECDAGKKVELQDSVAAAGQIGIETQSLPVRGPNDFPQAFQQATTGEADGLLVLGEALTLAHRQDIATFAKTSRLPSMYTFREFVDAGGLMAYGTNLPARFRYVATYADKILKGANPADLPVEQPTEFDFDIESGAAQALGPTLPASVLAQATEIIP